MLLLSLQLWLDNSSSLSKRSQMPCMISGGVLFGANVHVELQWLNLHLILSSTKLHNALNPLNHILKRFHSSCHPLWRLTPPCDLVRSDSCVLRGRKVCVSVDEGSMKYPSLLACVCINLTWLFVGLCCITWTQGKVLNEVLWLKSHVHISGGE